MRLTLLGFALGTLLLQHAARLPEAPVAAWGAILLLASAWPRAHALVRMPLAFAAGALLGYGVAALRADARLADALPRALEGEDLVVEGVVASLPQLTPNGPRFALATDGRSAPRNISLTWFAGEAPLPKLAAGDRWRMTVRLKRPRGLSNPHTFDFEAWALERELRATGYVRAKPAAERIGRVEGWPYTLHRWRGDIRDRMQAALGEARLRGVLVALVVGDQDSIAADDWDVFWRTGVGHLMSISGLHITMLGGLGLAVVAFLWVRVPALALRWPARKAGVLAGIAVALAYTLMTGYAVPAQRTFAMLATMAACVLLDRHASASRVLALAAFAVLLLDPWAVASPGFWLSFGAVAAILYAMAGRTGRGGKLAGAAREQLVVTIAMVPMLVALFQEVSLVSPLANAFAIPLVSLVVVPIAIVGGFLDLPALLDVAHALMQALMVPLEALASAPWAMWEAPEPAAWTVVAAVVGCAWLLAPRGFPMRAAGLVWMAPLLLTPTPAPRAGAAWIDVLDVGNGLAIVVRTAGHALLFDAGPSWSTEADSGDRIVVPFLRGEGVRALDALVISHRDDDHAGGAASVAYRRDTTWLLASLPRGDRLLGIATRTSWCRAGLAWTWDGVRFEMLHPPRPRDEPVPETKHRKENDWSCVLRVSTAAGAVLLTGDIEARSEQELLRSRPAALRADVLVVPHHGSRTSSTDAFIDAVAPGDAIFTVGYRNRFRHPNEKVAARYAARGIRAWRSDRDGAIRVELAREHGVVVVPHERPERYWRGR